MKNVFICDGIRTPIGRYGGALSSIRADDLAALPIKALMERNNKIDYSLVDDVVLGCANQSGEDNRNIARMASLLSGLPVEVPGSTINRLCGSGLNSIGMAAQAIKSAEADLIIAGGVESMSRAPYVIGKAIHAYGRAQEMYDTTMGWRFVNKQLDHQYGTDTMPKTAENLATEFGIAREDQDKFALASQKKAKDAQDKGFFADEIMTVKVPQKKGEVALVEHDEHLRDTSLEKLAKLKPLFEKGTVTAGNASGINDGAAALLVASDRAIKQHNLKPRAKIIGMSVAGVSPRIMGIGPVAASNKLLSRFKINLDDIDLFEFNEAFAVQALACTRQLGLKDDDPRINPQGGAIALGHPLGMSGSRLIISAIEQLHRGNLNRALCTMCIGVGQGIAMIIEKV